MGAGFKSRAQGTCRRSQSPSRFRLQVQSWRLDNHLLHNPLECAAPMVAFVGSPNCGARLCTSSRKSQFVYVRGHDQVLESNGRALTFVLVGVSIRDVICLYYAQLTLVRVSNIM